MSPTDYGRLLAKSAKPLTDEQVEAVARILASIDAEQVAA